jgi:hypothetical protein
MLVTLRLSSPIIVRGLPLGQLQETARFSGRGAPAAANSARIISIARPAEPLLSRFAASVALGHALGLHRPDQDVGLVEASAVVEQLAHGLDLQPDGVQHPPIEGLPG